MIERFPYISLRYCENYGGSIVFNSSAVPCSICNKDHESENIKKGIGSMGGCGEYLGERSYRLKCWKAYQNGIQIVTVKA